MAGQQIRMTPDTMRIRSNEVRQQGDAFEGVIKKMQSVINELQTEWEGAASQAFYDQFQRLYPHMNEMRQLIEEVSQQLYQTANAVEQLDSEIASKFGG